MDKKIIINKNSKIKPLYTEDKITGFVVEVAGIEEGKNFSTVGEKTNRRYFKCLEKAYTAFQKKDNLKIDNDEIKILLDLGVLTDKETTLPPTYASPIQDADIFRKKDLINITKSFKRDLNIPSPVRCGKATKIRNKYGFEFLKWISDGYKCPTERTDKGTTIEPIPTDTFEKGYQVIPNFFPTSICADLNRYYVSMIEQGFAKNGDRQVEDRYALHNDEISHWVRRGFDDIITNCFTGIKPTFSYVSAYKKGAILEKHTDRTEAAWTISVQITSNSKPWPLYVEGKKFLLKQGDAILFNGSKLSHSRDPLEDDLGISITFHYK